MGSGALEVVEEYCRGVEEKQEGEIKLLCMLGADSVEGHCIGGVDFEVVAGV